MRYSRRVTVCNFVLFIEEELEVKSDGKLLTIWPFRPFYCHDDIFHWVEAGVPKEFLVVTQLWVPLLLESATSHLAPIQQGHYIKFPSCLPSFSYGYPWLYKRALKLRMLEAYIGCEGRSKHS